MRAVVQRVASAEVKVGDDVVSSIGLGLVALVGIATTDASVTAKWMAAKLFGLRVFDDSEGKLNLAMADASGSLLLVSNFTVCGDASQGRRPSFANAMDFDSASRLFAELANECRALGADVCTGSYGAGMAITIVNDGPVTLVVDSP